MFKILITGANGFFGKSLIKQLGEDGDFLIFKYVRNDSPNDLDSYVKNSDFIFHFAGEVRPDSSVQELRQSNVILTENIITLLNKYNRRTPIVYTSSIHAITQTNEYGKTKRQSEILIEQYCRKQGVEHYIFRLPHVFGEGAKPNYNSVISTWIFNSINNLDINVYDREIKMNYVYIQDLLSDFIHCLDGNVRDKESYIIPECVYSTTLGDVFDYIADFKRNIDSKDYLIENNEFKDKLFATYLDYYKKNKLGVIE
jgi:UDP-2-acetamido-2,6-beta-L-arabino-hexul-4-ose reductase